MTKWTSTRDFDTYHIVERQRLPCSGPEDIKLFSCSTQLSTKFKLLIKTKIPKRKMFLPLSLSDVVFIMLINFKMPTIYKQDKFCAQLG